MKREKKHEETDTKQKKGNGSERHWVPTQIQVIGTEPFKSIEENGKLVWPSDHYGLYADFELRAKGKD